MSVVFYALFSRMTLCIDVPGHLKSSLFFLLYLLQYLYISIIIADGTCVDFVADVTLIIEAPAILTALVMLYHSLILRFP